MVLFTCLFAYVLRKDWYIFTQISHDASYHISKQYLIDQSWLVSRIAGQYIWENIDTAVMEYDSTKDLI